MKMRKGTEKKEDKKDDMSGSIKKSALSEGLMKSAKAAALVLGVGVASAGCSDNPGTNIPVPDGGQTDGAVDGGRVDGDVDSGRTDASVDADRDSGSADALVDSSTDAEDAFVPQCTGVSNASVSNAPFLMSTPMTVGGYSITYTTNTPSGVLLDIDCGSSGASVETGFVLDYGANDTILEVPADGKQLRMHLSSRTPWRATMSVAVEDL